MKTILIIILCLFAVQLSVSAALPPLAESIAEIKAILNDPELIDSLGVADSIESIQRNDAGYLVVTRNKTLQIDLVFLPAMRPGPAKFDLKFQNPNTKL